MAEVISFIGILALGFCMIIAGHGFAINLAGISCYGDEKYTMRAIWCAGALLVSGVFFVCLCRNDWPGETAPACEQSQHYPVGETTNT